VGTLLSGGKSLGRRLLRSGNLELFRNAQFCSDPFLNACGRGASYWGSLSYYLTPFDYFGGSLGVLFLYA